MLNHIVLLVAVVALASAIASLAEETRTEPVQYFVAVNGNDSWTGKLPAPNAAKTDGPFVTLTRARDALRELKGGDALRDAATVYVRGGEYLLDKTLELGPEDSGLGEKRPIVYCAYHQEKPVLVGAREIAGLRPYKEGILSAKLSKVRWASAPFKQLFFAGKRMRMARYPNFDPSNPYGGGFHCVADVPKAAGKPPVFKAPEGTLRKWARPEEIEVWCFTGHNYWNRIIPVKSIDTEQSLVTLAKANRRIRRGNRYFFRNVFEELDAPGEWYLDRRTWTLYFHPPSDVGSGRVMAPVVKTIVSIRPGTQTGQAPHDIELRGFTFEMCEGTGVVISGAERCRVTKSTVRNTGGHGISISGGHDNGAVGNDVYDVGSSAVAVSGGNRKTLEPAHNYADNNYAHHSGVYWKGGGALSVTGVGNRLSHNLIHDTPRWAMVFGGNDHVIEYNYCRHTNLETCDTGSIYACTRDWTQRGTIIRHNMFRDTLGYGPQGNLWVWPVYAWGIYLDDWTSGVTVFGNISVRAPLGPAFIHSGRDNVFENNILVEGQQSQMHYSPWPLTHRMLPGLFEKVQKAGPAYQKYPGLATIKDARKDATMSYNKFVRNIICYKDELAHLYAVNKLDYATTESDHNLIWHFGKALTISSLKQHPASRQWEEWQKLGFERHSVIADPLFVDAENDDYRLKPDSPAFELGFKPIPVERIGPYEDPLRATWPIVEAEGVRERPLICSKAVAHEPSELKLSLDEVPMVRVPGGQYVVGTSSEEAEKLAEEYGVSLIAFSGNRKRRVMTAGFLIDKYPVTNAQYAKYMAAAGAKAPAGWPGGKMPEGKGDHPVVNLNLDMMKAFAKWAGKRLPAADEWEIAARGPASLQYPWGNEWRDDACRIWDSTWPQIRMVSSPVGCFPAGASPFGVMDMEGLVCQWVTNGVMGAAAMHTQKYLFRPATRHFGAHHTYRHAWLGFRCARGHDGRPLPAEKPRPVPKPTPLTRPDPPNAATFGKERIRLAGGGHWISIRPPFFPDGAFSLYFPEQIGYEGKLLAWKAAHKPISTKWIERGHEMEYACEFTGFAMLIGHVKAGLDYVDFTLKLKNLTNATLTSPRSNTCLGLKGSPYFYDTERPRTGCFTDAGPTFLTRLDPRRTTFPIVEPGKAPLSAIAAIRPIMYCVSCDRKWIVAQTYDAGSTIAGNFNFGCLHVRPTWPDIPPGDERARTGKLYFLKGGPKELLKRWVEDFGTR